MNVSRLNYSSEEEDEYLIEESENVVNFSLKKCIKTEPTVIGNEGEESLSTYKNSKHNERNIKEEHFVEPKVKIQEDLDIKDEFEGDQFTAKHEENTKQKGERKYCCDKCSYETKRKNLIGPIGIHDKVNASKFSCNQCPIVKRHLRKHNRLNLICMFCQKTFKRKSELDAHYVCRHPERSDKWNSTITYKINECPKCLYKTVRTGDFKIHLATHGRRTDQAQFKCKFCEFKSICKANFITHLRLHAAQLPTVCTECDYRFSTKHRLASHIILRHSENEELIRSITSKIHRCERCDYKTVITTNFKKHLKKHVYDQTT